MVAQRTRGISVHTSPIPSAFVICPSTVLGTLCMSMPGTFAFAGPMTPSHAMYQHAFDQARRIAAADESRTRFAFLNRN